MGSKSGGCNSSTRNYDAENNKNNNFNWREYFKKANSDIFDIIEHAIMVAASDCSKEYRVRKSSIAELLFSCKMTRCTGCDRVELARSHDHVGNDGREVDDDDEVVKNCFGGDVDGDGDDDHGVDGGCKGNKVSSTSMNNVVDDGENGGEDDDDDVEIDVGGCEGVEMGLNHNLVEPGSDVSYGDEVEPLTDLIEEEKQLITEVLRIKDVLYNSQDESDSALFESLKRLQMMHLSISILKETEIGKAVNSIRRRHSKDIRHLARSLIEGWKIIVDEWVKTTQELAAAAEGGTPDSINPSTVEEEEGLPSPPMDDGVFFSSETIDFNQFFDGMDDDGNPRNSGEFNKNRRHVGKPPAVKPEAIAISKDNRAQPRKTQPPLSKPRRPSNTQSRQGRPNTNGDIKLVKESNVQPNLEKPVFHRRPTPPPEKLRPSNEDLVQEKLAATKRKLQERYQQAENAKRQRTIQVMDLQDLPKQGVVNKNPNGRFGNHNHHWANGRK